MSEYKTRDAVAEKLREVIRDLTFPEADGEVVVQTRLFDRKGLNLDSLDLVELVMEAEETFGIDEIPDDELEHVETFGQLVDLVCGKLGIGAAA